MIRVAIAGIVGGLVVFIGGFVSHMLLDLEGSKMKRLSDEPGFRASVSKHTPEPGIYYFPARSEGYASKSKEDQAKEDTAYAEEYKKGPAGLVVIAPTGEDPMGYKQLGMEALTDIGAALIAAWMVWMTGQSTRFMARWCMVVLLGLFTWLCTSASFAIWYRFPIDFTLDSLLGSLIEWTMAGLIIALLVKSKDWKIA